MKVGPGELRGLWQREIITYADGHTDASALIYWMQAESLYADVRIPHNLAPFRPNARLDDLHFEEMTELTRVGGFAGRIELEGGECRWIRKIDWQPDTGVEDLAQIEVDGNVLVEEGGACGGHQIWRRLTPIHAPTAGWELRDDGGSCDGVLVTTAGHFIYARGRANPISPASGLAEVLGTFKDDRERARALFDAEISYGTIDLEGAWIIARSTLPWRIGDVLLRPGTALLDRTLTVQEHDQNGRSTLREWDVVAYEDSSLGGG